MEQDFDREITPDEGCRMDDEFPPDPLPIEETEDLPICPVCGCKTTFTTVTSTHQEPHGEWVEEVFMECDQCDSRTDEKELAEANK